MADWQKGDLALCVDDSLNMLSRQCLRRGQTYTVEELDIDPAFAEIGLHLVSVPRPWSEHWQKEIGYSELRFVKVTPDEPTTEDLETISLMTTKPSKVEA